MKPYAIVLSIVLAGATLGAQEQEFRATMKAFGDGEAQVFVSGGDGQFEYRMPLNARTVKGAPYSAETVNESTQTLADGNRISHRTSGRVYRDGQGRVRREEDRPDGSQSVSIIDPVAGVSYSLNSRTHVAVKTPSAVGFAMMNKVGGGVVTTFDGRVNVTTGDRFEVQMKAMTEAMKQASGVPRKEFGRSAEQHATETLAAKTIEGVRAEGTRATTTIPADAIGNDLPIVITTEEWTSPELQVLVLTRHNDPRSGESIYRLVGIVRAEPDASLFQVPADFTVRETGIRQERRER